MRDHPALEALRQVPTLAEVEGVFLTEEDAYWANVEPEETCSLCDGTHGGFCPLEDSGHDPDDHLF